MQFSIPKDTRVFLRTGVTDLRLGFEGLRTLVANVIRQASTQTFFGCPAKVRYRPLRVNVIELIVPASLMSRTSSMSGKDQAYTTPPSLPVTSTRPSGENAMPPTTASSGIVVTS